MASSKPDKQLAARLQDELDALNREAEEGIDDAVWLFERTAAVAQAAISALKKAKVDRGE